MKKFLTLVANLQGGVFLKEENDRYEPFDSKKITLKYLNNHPKLEKHKGNSRYYYLKNSVLESPIITLGQSAMYFLDSDWVWVDENTNIMPKGKLTMRTPCGSGSGDARLFYDYAIPAVVDALVDKIESNVSDLVKISKDIPLAIKEMKVKENLEQIKHDF
jgi:hypothetical protein